MKLSAARIKKLCADRGLSLQAFLRLAGVSRTAYYSLLRRESVLPGSVVAIAGTLGVAPSTVLEEPSPARWRARALVRRAREIVARNPGASFENVWHTLVLLDEPPIDRLRRSLLRGRSHDFH